MNPCATCKHWTREKQLPWGECSRIGDELDIVLDTPALSTGGSTVDTIETPADFGCVLHEENET
jgi:hypothetical protein